MDVKIEKSWREILEPEFEKKYWKDLANFVKKEYLNEKVYPPPKFVFNAFEMTPFDKVKVVIIGQDPYHGPNQAHGLCFSVPEGIAIPPSLMNIYKEVKNSIGGEIPKSGNLEKWAKQGVLLLNETLTVKAGNAGSHQNKGWEVFTDKVIEIVSKKKENVIFMLWGNYARSKRILIDSNKHLILEAPHPSPLSAHRGFLGCGHFSICNKYLKEKAKKEIKWV